ncbi:MAG: ectonucleotide pyrophosphatase/phosphodiesterase [Balneolaceae bacterium]
MKKMLALLFLCTISCSLVAQKETPKLLLVSFDGFRPDYLSKTETPNFDKLAKSGVLGEGLIPIFPSKTFPNYYAIATGLYPENNGFIANRMYDEEMGLSFSMGDRNQVENPDWWKGEPIWNTVEKAGKKAGTMFWVGSEAPVQNMRPTFWKNYDGRMPNEARIDSVLSWMTLGSEKEIDFGTLYFSFVDSQGHRYGTDSEEIILAIQEADKLIGYLIQKLTEKDLLDSTNILIVSDHGMVNVSDDRLVVLDEFINTKYIEIIEGSPSLMMNVEEGKLDELYSTLKENETYFKVYKKQDIPERYHLKNSPRTPELLLIADLGYTINTKEFIEGRNNYPSGGAHGFDNLEKEMWGLFVASGPSFKKGFKIKPIENIHLYELMTHLLDIEPAETDGSIDSVKTMLR